MEYVDNLPSLRVMGMLCISSVLAEFNLNYFHADRRYNNLLPNEGTKWEFTVSSVTECSQECFLLADCVSVFYKDGLCIGWDIRIDDLTPTTPTDNVRYYELRGIFGNVAAGKQVVQSSTFPAFSGTYIASQAVDGSRYPVAVQPDDSCSCTGQASLEWWEVDLVDTFLIRDVAVLKRKDDSTGETLVNVTIGVAQVSGGTFTQCYDTGPTPSITRFQTFTCQTPIYGRYVKISKQVQAFLCLCEVEIYVLA